MVPRHVSRHGGLGMVPQGLLNEYNQIFERMFEWYRSSYGPSIHGPSHGQTSYGQISYGQIITVQVVVQPKLREDVRIVPLAAADTSVITA